MAHIRGDFLDISPSNRNVWSDGTNKENNNSLPVLCLAQFSRSPFVCFGTVKLGSCKSTVLQIENPSDGAVEVKVDRVASAKGFSVNQARFTAEPEESIYLTINWTPVEEGGVRELLVFTANDIVKHQAILLGRAEAQKKKKRSLWDSIKNKRVGATSVHCKESSLKKAANKTFHVSRQPQYSKERLRGPLGELSCPVDNHLKRSVQGNVTPISFQRTQAKSIKTENGPPVNEYSPVVLLVPAGKLIDAAACCENALATDPASGLHSEDVARVLNRTHSPLKTAENGVMQLLPCIHSSPSPIPNTGNCVKNQTFLLGTPVLSVKDALAIIQSDLSHVEKANHSNACSSLDFSDSLESPKENKNTAPCTVALEETKPIAIPDISLEFEPLMPRLTFMIKPKPVPEDTCDKGEKDNPIPTKSDKILFASSTVIKSKGGQKVENQGARKTTSRRRLLEKTLELSEDNHDASNLDKLKDVSGLPVIYPDTGLDARHDCDPVHSQLQALPPDLSPVRFADTDPFRVTVSSGLPLHNLSPFGLTQSDGPQTSAHSDFKAQSVSVVGSLLALPVESHVRGQRRLADGQRKRKSDEFAKENLEERENSMLAKRSRAFVLTAETKDSTQTKRFSSTSQRQHKSAAPRSLTSVASASRKSASSADVGWSKVSFSKPVQRGRQSVKSFGPSAVKTKVLAVAQSQLTFIRETTTVIPRHPLPFAAKNMFYDERWIEKQERGFTWWINYVLTPDDFKVNTEVTKVNAVSIAIGCDKKFSVPKAPTKEEMSFRTYMARSRLNRLRRAACHLFTSEAMVKAIQRLELEVEAKRLLMRKDRHPWKDIGQRQKILNWLLSYNPLWLRIGLETIYGELISLESNSDVMGLAVFILNRLLWNPDIAAEYRHPSVPHLYRDGHEEALSCFTLKKLLLLVCFLDKAKESRMIEHDPCLFCMDAEFKTSKDLLLGFSRDFLSGEGILSRHLGHLGLAVSHTQTPLDEFDFSVKNLAVDLKCGIRLVRVMELFTQNWSLSRKLRMPVISRLQKVHNVEVALQVLKSKGVDLKDEHGAVIDARDIVDGHREKTLNLLWKIIFAFQVDILLNEEQLKEEICFLKRMRRNRHTLSVRSGNQGESKKAGPTFKQGNVKMTLLMDWVNAVCAFYNAKAENFTVSFSDGQILCFLIHHYHPCHIPLEAIRQNTTQTVECGQRGTVGLNCSTSDSDCSFSGSPGLPSGTETSVGFRELLENERMNFQLVNTAVSSLGGVPAMINPADMSNTIPNEKVVKCYLSFLCARLLDLRNESRAAWIIQEAWRKYKLKVDEKLYKARSLAAAKIQVAVKKFLLRRQRERQNAAASVIQAFWWGYLARRESRLLRLEKLRILQDSAATVIQTHWRRYSAVKNFQQLKHFAIVVQASLRMKFAVIAYKKVLWGVGVIQKRRRAAVLAREKHQKYLRLKRAVLTIQKGFRRWQLRTSRKRDHAASVLQAAFRKWKERKLARRNHAAVKIQSWYRMQRCRRRYAEVLEKTILIQAWCRGTRERNKLRNLKLRHFSATVIQKAFKAYVCRRRFVKMKRASVIIQSRFRAWKKMEEVRERYRKIKLAAVVLQAAYRGYLVCKVKRVQHDAATVIQAAFRKSVTRRRFLSLKSAAVALQKRYRATLLGEKQRKEYLLKQRSVLRLQFLWRIRAKRKRIEEVHKATTLIQSSYRRHVALSKFRAMRAAALVIQSQYRAYSSGKKVHLEFLEKRQATVALQAGFRGMKVRRELRRKHNAATRIQAAFRVSVCRQKFVSLKRAAVAIQRRYRANRTAGCQRQQYRLLLEAAVKIQAAYRGSRVRRDIRSMRQAAVIIQAYFRMHKAQLTFCAMRCAATVIQQRYRACVTGTHQRASFLQMRESALVIQAAFRGMRARHQVRNMHKAAVVIQANYRKHVALMTFRRLRWAASVISRRFRSIQAKRAEVQKRVTMKNAAVCIQSAFRGIRARKRLQKMVDASQIIQRSYLAHRQHKRYLLVKGAVIKIQLWYRALVATRLQRKRYLSFLVATRRIQAAYRGMIVRRQLQRKRHAATVIQSAFRMYRTRMPFKAMRLAATVIQRQYRSYLEGKRRREHFLKLRLSATIIQAIFRAKRERREIVRMRSAAIVIQAQFRMRRCCMQFRKQRWAAKVVQERYRARKVQDLLMREYRLKRTAAVVIQSAFRDYKCRQQLMRMHKAAVVIQRWYRAVRERAHFLSLRAAAIVIQQKYRALIAARTVRKGYLMKCRAVIALQSAYRRMKVRKRFQMEHRAAAVIQAHVRKHLVRTRYKRLLWATKAVQHCYRGNKRTRSKVQKWKEKCHAVVLIQAFFRGMRTRQHIKRLHVAATEIQRTFRAHRSRKLYLALRSSALAIQLRYRAVTAVKLQRACYKRLRSAAITLQAAYRGWKIREGLNKRQVAATILQAAFRRHKEMVKYQAMKLSALVIQRHYKSHVQRKLEREKFLRLRDAAVSIQSVFRGQKMRREVAQMHKAATLIQSTFRMHRQQATFKSLRWAADVIQQRLRAQRLRNAQMRRYQRMRKAAVCIQASFRAKKERQVAKRRRAARIIQSFLKASVERRRFLQKRTACIVIQSSFRRRRAQIPYQRMQASALLIQKWYRSCRVSQKQRAEYVAVRRATVMLQSSFRGMLARKLEKRKRSAVKVQSVLRMAVYRRRFLSLRSSTVKLQAYCRMCVVRRQFKNYQMAASTLQKRFRAWQKQKEQRAVYLKTLKSIQTVQAKLRGHIEYKTFQKLRRSATTIQAFYRGMVQKRKFQHQKASVRKIQAYYRAYVLCREERLKYLSLKKSAVLLQAVFRGHRTRRLAKELQAVIKIQAWFRRNMSRRKFRVKQNAIVTIRRCMQTRLDRNRFLKIRSSVCIIQRRWKEVLQSREERQNFLKLRACTVKMQALWRGQRIRHNLLMEKRASCVIQAFYRGYLQRRAFQRKKKAALVLQRHFWALQSGRDVRENFKAMKGAVVTLQAFFRGWLIRRRLKEEAQTRRMRQFSAAVTIQRAFRAHRALESAKRQIHSVVYIQRRVKTKLQRKRYLQEKKKIIMVQRAVRKWLSQRHKAATVVQHVVKKFLLKRREQRVQGGIVKLQALWRGHCSRQLNDTSKIVALRHRFRRVNLVVKEEDRLCNKTTTAIAYLLRYKHFSYILAALKHLETATRLSPECCEHLVKSGATSVIFTLIKSCNRSVPCMEVITFAIQVLLNLSKYEKTIEAVYDVDSSVDTLLELLQIYREKAGDKVADKGGSIFTKACFLLAILLQDERRALEVRNLPKALDRIRSIYRLTVRKHTMDAQRTVVRQKMNVSLNGSFFSQTTPKLKRAPRFAPDWVLRKDNVNDVADPLRAIRMLADAFGIIP